MRTESRERIILLSIVSARSFAFSGGVGCANWMTSCIGLMETESRGTTGAGARGESGTGRGTGGDLGDCGNCEMISRIDRRGVTADRREDRGSRRERRERVSEDRVVEVVCDSFELAIETGRETLRPLSEGAVLGGAVGAGRAGGGGMSSVLTLCGEKSIDPGGPEKWRFVRTRAGSEIGRDGKLCGG